MLKSRGEIRHDSNATARISGLVTLQRLVVSSSGFYAWLQRSNFQQGSQPQSRKRALILAALVRTGETFGAIQLHRFLKQEGHAISLWRVRKLRRENGISCVQRKKYTCRTTDSKHFLPVTSNLLARCFLVRISNPPPNRKKFGQSVLVNE